MKRSKALIASAVVATTLVVGAGVYFAGSGVLAGETDNVGNLQPIATSVPQPDASPEITVFVDPATGAASTVDPNMAYSEDDYGHDEARSDDDQHSDDDGHDKDDKHDKDDRHEKEDREDDDD